MGEFEKARMEKALKNVSNEDLCVILESTGLSVKDCWDKNTKKANKSLLLRKVSSRIDELTQEHWKKQRK